MKKLMSVLCFVLLTNYLNAASSVTLAWNISCNTNIEGYKIYQGVATGGGAYSVTPGYTDECGNVVPTTTNTNYRTYTNQVTVAGRSNNSVVISNLQTGLIYCFAATCFDSVGLESDYSFEVALTNGVITNPPPVTNIVGLVAAYSFNEGSGTVVKDSSTNGYDKTILGDAAWTTSGKYSNALSFDGVNDYINWGNTFNYTQFTFSAWIYPTDLGSAWRSFIMKRQTFGMEEQNGIMSAKIRGPGGTWGSGVPATLTLNTWQYVAQTYNGQTNRIYLNGVQTGQEVITLQPVSTNLLIGSWDSASEFFQGRMDEVRLYSKALSAAEILSDMNTPIGTVQTNITLAPPRSVKINGVSN